MTASAATLEPAVASPAAAPPPPDRVLGRARAIVAGAGPAVLVCTVSAFVIGPAVTGGSESATSSRSVPSQAVPETAPSGVSPSEHEAHHH